MHAEALVGNLSQVMINYIQELYTVVSSCCAKTIKPLLIFPSFAGACLYAAAECAILT